MENADQYKNLKFKDRHWNTYIDLTGDCLPDMVLVN